MLAFIAAAVVLRIWRADLDVPLIYSGDSLLVLSATKQALNDVWYLTNSSLGAPFGQHLQDFPVFSGDPIHILTLELLDPFVPGDYPVVYNVFFLLGFPLAAVSAFVVLRVLGVSRPTGVVCGVLFAILPFHFTIGAARPFETGYWVIPICCYLILAVIQGWELFTRSPTRRGLLAFATPRTLWTLLLCIVVGSAGIVYFSLFTAILLVVAAGLVSLRLRRVRAAVPGIAVIGAIIGTLALNALPTIIYQIEHGNAAEEASLHRARHSEEYSLSLTQLLLPIPGDRIDPLEELRDEYSTDVAAIPTVAKEAGLGPIAGTGLLFLIGLALAGAVGAVRRSGGWALQLDAAALTVASLLIATTGGFSSLIAQLITAQFRVWQRYYIFIAFFALLAIAFLLDAALRRFARGSRAPVVTAGILGTVLVVGALEQTSRLHVPPYETAAAEFESDGQIVSEIEGSLPEDAQVFQLPYLPFPSWGPVGKRGGAIGFDGFRPSLHSSDLRFSYGATRGRAEDWQASLVDKPITLVLPSLAAAGFDGLLVDTAAYDDDANRLDHAVNRLTGSAPNVSPDGRHAFFDLRSYRQRLTGSHTPDEIERLRTATLYPLRVKPGSGLAERRQNGAYTLTHLLEEEGAELVADNPSSEERVVTLQLSLSAAPGSTVEVRLPDGQGGTIASDRPFTATAPFPPGTSEISLEASPSALARGDLYVVIEARDSALAPFLQGSPRDAISPQTGWSQRATSQPSPLIVSPP